MRTAITGTVVMVVLIAACGSAERPDSGFSVRDSAGIRITTVDMSREDLPEWSLELPGLVLDGTRPPYFQRITSAGWTAAGGIVVLDRNAHQIQVFDADGALARSFGRAGDGPGEFSNIALVTVSPNDTLFVFDRIHRRVSVFHPRAGFVRDLPMRPDSAGISPLDVWSIGPDRFALYTQVFDLSWEDDYDGRPMILPTLARITIHDGTGARVAGPLTTAGPSYGQFAWGSGVLPFLPVPVFAGADGRFIIGAGDAFEVTTLDAGLRPIAIMRWPSSREPLTEAELDAYREEASRTYAPLGTDRVREILELSLSDAALPELRPAHGRIIGGRDGSLWVSRFDRTANETDWVAFDPEGRPAGRLLLPDGARLMAADLGRVLYVLADSLDVQSVRSVALLRP